MNKIQKKYLLYAMLALSMLSYNASALTYIDSCTDISSPGIYQLNKSIIDSNSISCININSSDVIFDGGGYTIDGISTGMSYGVYVFNSFIPTTNVTVTNLTVSDWGSGINYNARYGNIANNRASNNTFGVYIPGFGDLSVTRNNLSGNTYGITVGSSFNNNISENIITQNSGHGIQFFSTSANNHVYNNYFNNTDNFALDVATAIWNITKTPGINIIGGPYMGGNFWGYPNGTGFSQTCTDSDGDGICDSTYTLGGINNFDYLPLTYNTVLSSSVGYSALVATGQNTYVQSSNGTFGLLLKGQSKTISNSVVLNNTGDTSAKVEARFNDSRGGVFGLVSGANVLNATNFALGIPGALMPLSSLGANVQVAVAPPGATALDARLSVPSNQTAGDYTGTVIVTFSNNI